MVEAVEWCIGGRVRECERGLLGVWDKMKKKREQSKNRGGLAGQRGDILREKEWWGIKGWVGGAYVGKKSDHLFFFFFSLWLGCYSKNSKHLLSRGLVNKLTFWSSVWMNSRVSVPTSISSRMNWCHISICFVREFWTWFLEMLMALVLLQ